MEGLGRVYHLVNRLLGALDGRFGSALFALGWSALDLGRVELIHQLHGECRDMRPLRVWKHNNRTERGMRDRQRKEEGRNETKATVCQFAPGFKSVLRKPGENLEKGRVQIRGKIR